MHIYADQSSCSLTLYWFSKEFYLLGRAGDLELSKLVCKIWSLTPTRCPQGTGTGVEARAPSQGIS